MKTKILVKIATGFEISQNQTDMGDLAPYVDPNCSDIELAKVCENLCIDDLAKCITDCSTDSTCAAACYRAEIDCIDSCPCHADCPQGEEMNNDISCIK